MKRKMAIGLAAAILAGESMARAETVSFETIRPVLETKCVKCHGRFLPLGGLKLLSRDHLLKGGASGPAVVPGSAAESLMTRQFRLPKTDPKHMPPVAEPPLTEGEIALIEAWIDGGAR